MKRVCIVGISGKLGQYMTEHALARGYTVNGVCRPESTEKLARFGDRITIFPGRTDDQSVIAEAVKDCDGVLTVLVPWGVADYASGTARAVLAHADPGARLAFSCGLHITMDGKDVYSWYFKALVSAFGWLARVTRFADISDQVRACDMIFASDLNWTVVRGPNLDEGESEGLPLWATHVGDPVVKANIVRRTDFALFMVDALTNPDLIGTAPVIVSRTRVLGARKSGGGTTAIA
ncbi:MAG: NAD(P)H-binding protein [Pseudomonadota bacterium]